ncbi:Hypothetical predicted protein [Lecanosticta acicola]|uniref:Uncharacterized protein n=1 Tax=Lecanosticta acicola TaxID=111012 RepID=A0AAI8YWY6_9PEZI|nr:Hypothetical predicted protein [Lecanosticta acicola]
MITSPQSSYASEYSPWKFVTATAQDSDDVVASELEQTTLNDIAAVNARDFSAESALFQNKAPYWEAERTAALSLKTLTVAEFVASIKKVTEDCPDYHVRAIDSTTSVNKSLRTAEVFANFETTGRWPGVARRNVTTCLDTQKPPGVITLGASGRPFPLLTANCRRAKVVMFLPADKLLNFFHALYARHSRLFCCDWDLDLIQELNKKCGLGELEKKHGRVSRSSDARRRQETLASLSFDPYAIAHTRTQSTKADSRPQNFMEEAKELHNAYNEARSKFNGKSWKRADKDVCGGCGAKQDQIGLGILSENSSNVLIHSIGVLIDTIIVRTVLIAHIFII